MKSVIVPIFIVLIILITIIFMPVFLPKRDLKKFTDNQLRQTALSRNMLPVPKTYNKLLKLVNTKDNPMTKDKVLLGKKLFNDTILSKDNTISCAFCHILKNGGANNLPTAIGYKGRANPFHLNTPTVLNAALAKELDWDGSAKTLEIQASGPLQAHFEMNSTPKKIVQKLKNNPYYSKEFKKVFTGGVSFENVKKAIGAYERTLLTRGSYDRFLEGDNNAISQKAKKGFALFINLGCKGCHTGMSVGGQSLQKFPLRQCATIYETDCMSGNRIFPFKNIGGFLGKDNMQLFRVPILRNIARTAPYFHNGAVKKLSKAVKIMAIHQIGVNLSKIQISEIVAFLKTLNGKIVDYNITSKE